MMDKLVFYSKKSRVLLQFLRNAHHIGIFKAARIVKKRIYCKINNYPNSLIVEPASKCNLSCTMCWAYKAKDFRKNNILGYLEYQRIIDDVESICSRILLGFCGEPMLNENIYKMINYASQKNMIVSMPTNGMLLTRNNAVKLLYSGLYEIIISLDAASSDTYKSMRIGGNFGEVVENVRFLADEKKKRKSATPIIVLQMVLTQKNDKEINEFIKLANSVRADRVAIKSLFIDHHGDDGYTKKLADEFVTTNHVSRYKKDDRGSIVLRKTGVCPSNKSPVISSDGDIYICCFDILGEYKQGNAIKENFFDIWNKYNYKQFREKEMVKRRLPLCRTCIYPDAPEIHISLK